MIFTAIIVKLFNSLSYNGEIMSRQLFKETLVVSSMTFISRILGFVRDMLIARLFGVTVATDAFFVAFKLPNFFRRLFGEGALAHVFVPVLADYQAQNDKTAVQNFIDKTTGNLALILLLFTIIGMIATPVLIWLLAPGFVWNSTQHDLAASMLRICFPYLAFITLVAFAGGVLNAYGRFALTALTPVLLNICMIGAAIWLAPRMSEPVFALAWGVLIAGVAQLLVQIPLLIHLKLLPRPRIDFQDPSVKRLRKRVIPAVFSVSVTQINLLLDTLIASFLTAGSVSWLYYSDRLVEFPVGILGLALGTVILPKLANAHTVDDPQAFSKALDWGLRLVVLASVPATIGLILLAKPLLSTLFQYHEFTVNDVRLSAQSLCAYSIGLLGYILIKVLVSGFTARQDMKTPVRYGVYAMIASLSLNVLVIPFAHAGLALATSLGAFINAGLLLRKLLKLRIYSPALGWRLFMLRVTLAGIVLTVFLYYGVDATLWYGWSSGHRVLYLVRWISLGVIVYIGTLFFTGLRPNHLVGRIDF